jgi:lipoprotein NlpD
MHKFFWLLIMAFLLISLAGCSGNYGVYTHAPVVSGWKKTSSKEYSYLVQRGDTLYSIAWAFEMDYRDLARVNKLHSPYRLKSGQKLIMAAKSQSLRDRVRKHTAPKKLSNVKIIEITGDSYNKSASTLTGDDTDNLPKPKNWRWPINGKVSNYFSLKRVNGNKGIDISASSNSFVLASNAGRVVYSGSGIQSYGNLVIIKHNQNYLSAYGHNRKILVKEGDVVSAGQKIALLGVNDSGETALHFEIRRNGQPVNPLNYLP